MNPFRKLSVVLLVAIVLTILWGCGGGGGGSTTTGSTPGSVSAVLDWPNRTRATAPTSALSVKITVTNPQDGSTVASSTVNRTQTTAYSQTVTIPNVPVGSYNVFFQFTANADGLGSTVATGSVSITVSSGQTVTLPSVNFTKTIANTMVNAVTGPVTEGDAPFALSFTAMDADGGIVAVTPGSEQWSNLSIVNVGSLDSIGNFTPTSAGTATVRVTVDGVQSPPTNFTIQSAVPTVSTIALDSNQIGPREVRNLTITLSRAAPSGGFPVTLTDTFTFTDSNNVQWPYLAIRDSNGNIQPNSTVTVPAGQTTHTVQVVGEDLNPATATNASVSVVGQPSVKFDYIVNPLRVTSISTEYIVGFTGLLLGLDLTLARAVVGPSSGRVSSQVQVWSSNAAGSTNIVDDPDFKLYGSDLGLVNLVQIALGAGQSTIPSTQLGFSPRTNVVNKNLIINTRYGNGPVFSKTIKRNPLPVSNGLPNSGPASEGRLQRGESFALTGQYLDSCEVRFIPLSGGAGTPATGNTISNNATRWSGAVPASLDPGNYNMFFRDTNLPTRTIQISGIVIQ